jgi:murein L,D-transpeptidase YcbB/YkuD
MPAGRPVRPAGFAMVAMAALIAAAPVQPAVAATTSATAESNQFAGPQWVTPDQRAAIHLIALLQTADLDGLDPGRFNVKPLLRALRDASDGDFKSADRANAAFDRALVDYATALRSVPSPDWTIVDRAAIPATPSAAALLADATAAPSLERWVDAMPFMHQSYAGLRRALAMARERGDAKSEALLRVNLNRARFLPAGGRYVLVNTAAQQLYMYEDGRPVDSMRVVVGKPVNPTPTMAAMIRFMAVNPYWNVPTDLAAERVAPHVVKEGPRYLTKLGYVVLSDWSDHATPVDPSTIDWAGVADGRVKIRVRQDPGPHNAMGRMKFMFPNPQGVYLHDTPDRELLNEAARLFSGGCVRLEDAPRLAKWLYGAPLEIRTSEPEQPINLDQPVPVYLAYLTAVPSDGQIVFYDDIYGKDRSELAASGDGRVAAR